MLARMQFAVAVSGLGKGTVFWGKRQIRLLGCLKLFETKFSVFPDTLHRIFSQMKNNEVNF